MNRGASQMTVIQQHVRKFPEGCIFCEAALRCIWDKLGGVAWCPVCGARAVLYAFQRVPTLEWNLPTGPLQEPPVSDQCERDHRMIHLQERQIAELEKRLSRVFRLLRDKV